MPDQILLFLLDCCQWGLWCFLALGPLSSVNLLLCGRTYNGVGWWFNHYAINLPLSYHLPFCELGSVWICWFLYINAGFHATEHNGEKDDPTEVHGEPTAAWSVRHAAPGSPVCGELGGWLGFHRSYEVSSLVAQLTQLELSLYSLSCVTESCSSEPLSVSGWPHKWEVACLSSPLCLSILTTFLSLVMRKTYILWYEKALR